MQRLRQSRVCNHSQYWISDMTVTLTVAERNSNIISATCSPHPRFLSMQNNSEITMLPSLTLSDFSRHTYALIEHPPLWQSPFCTHSRRQDASTSPILNDTQASGGHCATSMGDYGNRGPLCHFYGGITAIPRGTPFMRAAAPVLLPGSGPTTGCTALGHPFLRLSRFGSWSVMPCGGLCRGMQCLRGR